MNGGRNANIDHIIPRKDVSGCGCGTNSPKNAIVISRLLNNEMSNDVEHPLRIQILGQFTNYSAVFGAP